MNTAVNSPSGVPVVDVGHVFERLLGRRDGGRARAWAWARGKDRDCGSCAHGLGMLEGALPAVDAVGCGGTLAVSNVSCGRALVDSLTGCGGALGRRRRRLRQPPPAAGPLSSARARAAPSAMRFFSGVSMLSNRLICPGMVLSARAVRACRLRWARPAAPAILRGRSRRLGQRSCRCKVMKNRARLYAMPSLRNSCSRRHVVRRGAHDGSRSPSRRCRARATAHRAGALFTSTGKKSKWLSAQFAFGSTSGSRKGCFSSMISVTSKR